MDISERRLIEGLRTRDPDSVRELMDIYSGRLMKTAFIMVKDKGLSEDIVQDTFIKLINNIERFNEQSSLYTYLYSIALNECRQRMRKNWFKKVVLFDKWLISQGQDRSFVDNRIDKLSIAGCIGKLDLKYKEVVLLYYFEDMSIDMICNVTGEKVGTVKSRLKRARDILKKLLKEAGYQDE